LFLAFLDIKPLDLITVRNVISVLWRDVIKQTWQLCTVARADQMINWRNRFSATKNFLIDAFLLVLEDGAK